MACWPSQGEGARARSDQELNGHTRPAGPLFFLPHRGQGVWVRLAVLGLVYFVSCAGEHAPSEWTGSFDAEAAPRGAVDTNPDPRVVEIDLEARLADVAYRARQEDPDVDLRRRGSRPADSLRQGRRHAGRALQELAPRADVDRLARRAGSRGHGRQRHAGGAGGRHLRIQVHAARRRHVLVPPARQQLGAARLRALRRVGGRRTGRAAGRARIHPRAVGCEHRRRWGAAPRAERRCARRRLRA